MKNKTYTILNVIGLALGLAVSIIIYLYLHSETNYDTYIPNYKHIYRLESEFKLTNEQERLAGTSLGMGPMLSQEFDYIHNYTRLFHIQVNVFFKHADRQLYEDNISIADSNFFNVFKIPLLEGNPQKCLAKPYSIVVTKSFARRYFGDEDPYGKIVSTNNHDYTITGVINDLPANSHHKFDALLSAFYEPISRQEMQKTLWQANVFTFVELQDNAQARRLEKDFPKFYQKYMANIGNNFDGYYRILATRIDKIHYGEGFQYDRSGGNRAYLYAFAAIGILILVLACINYINMATARGLRRVKEAGLRKILGGDKRDIRLLIFSESLLLCLVSLFLAFVLVELILQLTPFNEVVGEDLALDFTRLPSLWWVPLSLAVLVGFLSGIYPAINLSKVPELAAIRGGYKVGRQNVVIRKLLVGFQFCISVAVVITALLMYRQMDYVRNKDLGFNKEDVLLIPIQDTTLYKKIPEIRDELESSPNVVATSTAFSVPGENMERTLLSLEKNAPDTYRKHVVDMMYVGYDYFRTMEIHMDLGRDFIPGDFDDNSKGVIVNEKMVKEMGWENPLGKIVKWGFDEGGKELYRAKVVGVVEDFNAHSLHDPIEPTVIFLFPDIGQVHIRVDSKHLMQAISDVENIWSKADTKNPFRFSFLDKDLMKLYHEEQKQSRLILYLTYLAILISFLGLTGLASFTTGLRTREIGIRKVLGADVTQMVNLIFREMLLLVVVSVLLAIPLAYYLIKGWLTGFAFYAALDPLVFAFSAIFAVFLAYLIVSYHSIKVARSNPVDVLKYS